jgi:DNA-binding beta-propeller fold protein YncE
MRKLVLIVVVLAIGVGIGFWISNKRASVAEGQAKPGAGFAALPGSLGAEDVDGPYEVVKGWPKDVSTLPGNEKWTYGAAEGVFAETPNRVYMLFRGELPKMAPPKARLLPELGPSISFPVAGLWRDTTTASPPGTGGTDNNMAEWLTAWEGKAPDIGIKGPPYRKMGVDANWENCLVVVDGQGNIIETWKQWDKLFRRPHSVYISPYDPDKNVWVVDDNMQVIYKFTHDGKQLLQTIGTPEKEGADANHFNRPTYLDWLPDGTFYVSDGYTGTRVAKFDKNGKFIMDWGIKGGPRGGGDNEPIETRPGYFSNVHGIAIDQKTRQVFVNDRNNHRIQVFDENGKYLREWKVDASPSSLHLLYIGSGNTIWTFDRTTNKMVEWDLQGHLLYAWGTMGNFPGALWGVHGMSVDQDGNLYLAEVDNGRVEKFTPKAGANPAFVVAKPNYSAWKD